MEYMECIFRHFRHRLVMHSSETHVGGGCLFYLILLSDSMYPSEYLHVFIQVSACLFMFLQFLHISWMCLWQVHAMLLPVPMAQLR